jgi:isopenicillin-N N-acyltransferase-like protein
MSFPFPTYLIDADTAFERGVQHGSAARDQIAISVNTYHRLFCDFVRIDWSTATELAAEYETSITTFDPELFEEIRGVASGSGFEVAEILALNARSEIGLSSRIVDGCTAFAAFDSATQDNATILCQNWDWRASQREAFVVLKIERPGKPDITMLTEAGIIGKIGFNSRGLGVCLNAIVTAELDPRGTPLHVILRGILESRNLGEAIETVARTPIASAANFLVAQDRAGAVDIEAAPSAIDILLPEDDLLAHTNHLQGARVAGVRDLCAQVLPDSYPRLARVRKLLRQHHGRITTEVAQEILRDHANEPDSICRHEDELGDPEGKRLQSVFSLVMDLREPEVTVTDGPPCSGDYFALEGLQLERAASVS